MSPDDNVILFPRSNNDAPPQSLDDIRERLNSVQIVQVQSTVEAFCPVLRDFLVAAGYGSLVNNEASKDVALIIASLQSALLKARGQFHPCQLIADQFFKQSSEGLVINLPDGGNE